MHIDRNGNRPPLTASGDAAITACGKWLRRSKLDELPQLIDVLRGEMSLVGPRPELPVYVEAYPPDVRARVLSVRPGITNMESIAFWNESCMLAEADDIEALYLHSILPAKLKYADRYASEHGFWTDLRILLLTLKVLITGSGPSVSGLPEDRSAERECEEQRLG
jgi:lipopolysaccharide/colanic/teichoic acid biosynthesis glycosyltransferase